MKISPVPNQTFKSKLPPAKLQHQKDFRYTDGWSDLANYSLASGKESELISILDKLENDGNDTILAFEKHISGFGIENYYLGVYDNFENLAQDRRNGNFLKNTINGKYIWFQKGTDGFYKIPNRITTILGESFTTVAFNLLNKIVDKNSNEHKNLYNLTDPEQLLRRYRIKI